MVLKFVPQADIALLDPHFAPALVTRNHAYMVYDTLYGVDDAVRPHPQVAAGHVIEDGGKIWTITLREGLRFHDGEKVLARDAVASLKRWAKRSTRFRPSVLSTSSLPSPTTCCSFASSARFACLPTYSASPARSRPPSCPSAWR
jgi:peptide/nickel transport system substrate-binding protein